MNWLEPLESRRLLAHIGIDPNFGDGGNAPLGGSMLLAPQPDGKILVATHLNAQAEGYRVARLNADGTLDGSFDDVVVDDIFARRTIIHGSRVLVVREPPDPNATGQLQFHAINLATGGTDTTFGDAGIATITPPPLRAGFRISFHGVNSVIATPTAAS